MRSSAFNIPSLSNNALGAAMSDFFKLLVLFCSAEATPITGACAADAERRFRFMGGCGGGGERVPLSRVFYPPFWVHNSIECFLCVCLDIVYRVRVQYSTLIVTP